MAMREAALDWLIRQRDPAFGDWEAFGDWLAADPDRARVYHELAAADADVGEWFAAAPPAAAPVEAPPVANPVTRRRFGGWLGGAIAASLVAVSGYTELQNRADPYSIETAPGERRSIALADGSQVDLNGGSRITLDHRNQRIATLDRGEALFTVVHDDRRPFIVHAAGAELRDVGTVFNVVSDRAGLSVAVAEGAVVYNPRGESVELGAGRTLHARANDSVVTLGTADPAAMVAWKQGRLIYDGTPIGVVAEDISRNLGLPVSVAPDVAARPFRGVIALDGQRDRFLERLGPLLDVRIERGGKGWVLTAKQK